MSVKHKIGTHFDLKAVGRRIREIRGFELTQQEFGEILGIGQAQLSKYEKGLVNPSLEVLFVLRSYSGRSIDWILTGEEAYRSSNARSKS